MTVQEIKPGTIVKAWNGDRFVYTRIAILSFAGTDGSMRIIGHPTKQEETT